jgi:hypothetical protein
MGNNRMTTQNASGNQVALLARHAAAPLYRLGANADRQIRFAQKIERLVINLFIGCHLLAIAFWCVPVDSPLIPLCRSLVQPYFLWAGLFQSWDMFAPIPKATNMCIEATLRYRDGSERTWTFPRVEQMDLKEKVFKERYRKFADNLQRDELDELLPDAARYIARMNSNPGNPVRTVILIQRFSFIVPRPDGSYVPEPWQSHILLGYGVRPGDLQ